MRIRITTPAFTPDEIRAVCDVLQSGWLTQGKAVKRFEEKVATRCGAPFAATCNSGTSALQLAYLAAGICPGDEIIVPSFGFVATANALETIRAKIRFCDIDPQTFNASSADFEHALTSSTKGLVTVHQFGQMSGTKYITKLARDRQLLLIEDAACALGAQEDNKHPGHLSDCATFSFHPRKIITTAEGGMVVTRNQTLHETVLALRSHGMTGLMNTSIQDCSLVGYNMRLTEIQGALGELQVNRLDEIISRRRQIARCYNDRLKKCSTLTLPTENPGSIHTYQSYVCLLQKDCTLTGNDIIAKLAAKSIESRPGAHAIHTLPYYKTKYGLDSHSLKNSTYASEKSFALPIHQGLSDSDVEEVVTALKEIL